MRFEFGVQNLIADEEDEGNTLGAQFEQREVGMERIRMDSK